MKNLLIKYFKKNTYKIYIQVLLIIIFILFLLNFKLNIYNNQKFNSLNDIDLSSSTDFEDFSVVLNDSIEVVFHDYSLLSDGFIDIVFYLSSFLITSNLIKNIR